MPKARTPKLKPLRTPRAPAILTGLEINLGRHLDDACEMFDTETVFALFVVAARQQLAEHIRAKLAKDPTLTPAEIARIWTPVVKRRGLAPAAKVAKLTATMSVADKRELAESLLRQVKFQEAEHPEPTKDPAFIQVVNGVS